MQKPITPSLSPVTAGWAARKSTAPLMSRAARSAGISVISRAALSISVCCASSPWYKSGVSATNPASPSRSATSLMLGSSPHHSCTTTTPGPEPLSGTTRYPAAVLPLLANSTVSAMCRTIANPRDAAWVTGPSDDIVIRLLDANEANHVVDAITAAYGDSYDVPWAYDTTEICRR